MSNEGKSEEEQNELWRSGRDDDLLAMADRSVPSSLGAICRVNRCRVRRSGVSYCDQLENHSSVPVTPTGPGRSAVAHWTLYLQYYIDARVHTYTPTQVDAGTMGTRTCRDTRQRCFRIPAGGFRIGGRVSVLTSQWTRHGALSALTDNVANSLGMNERR